MPYRLLSVLISAAVLACACSTTPESSSVHTEDSAKREPTTEPLAPVDPDWRSPVNVDPQVRREVEKLIDGLRDIEPEGRWARWLYSGGFPLAEGAYDYLAEVWELWDLRRHPESVHRLCEIGAAAVPVLCEHLLDERKTRIEWDYSDVFMGGAWFAQEYDWNDGWQQSPGSEYHYFGSPEVGDATTHTFRVGDLCYAIIGKIVNRTFHAARAQPSMCYVLNSPIMAPDLATLTRRDWGDLTPEKLRETLIRDWYQPDRGTNRSRRWTGAYVRLAHYWPEDAVRLVREWLQKPRADWFALYDVYETLEQAIEANELDGVWSAAREELSSPQIEVLISLIRRQAADVPSFPGEPAAKTMLRTLFPGEDPYQEREYQAVTNLDLRDGLDRIVHDDDEVIDDLVAEILADVESYFPGDAYNQEALAFACVERLHRRARNDEVVLDYIGRRKPGNDESGEKLWAWYQKQIEKRAK